MFFCNFVSKAEYSVICSRIAVGTFFDRLDDIGSKMHFKNGVLSEFRKVRSSERLDLLCSLLDACLPFELRFLGTCLEFLGKRDFNELREDERLANNVNHISQFRSLTDENTRRKLVLYVSLLKSSNSDCVNYFSDILASINMEEVGLVHGTVTNDSSLEAMNKLMDELLLLYTIAINHPAFTIHQKSKFAVILAQLQDEDKKLCGVRRSEKDSNVKYSDFCQQCGGVGELADSLKLNDEVVLEMPLPDCNRGLISAPLVGHISPMYSSMEAPSPTLSQGSSISLSGPPPPPPACQVIVPSVCGHTTMSLPVQVQPITAPLESTLESPQKMSTSGPMGDRSPSQTSAVMTPSMQPAPTHMPPSGTVPSSTSPCLLMNTNLTGVPQGPVSSSSHCFIPTTGIPSGDLNMSKHAMIPPGLLNMSPDPMMHMQFPGTTWGVLPMPTIGNPTSSPSPTSGQADNATLLGTPITSRDGPSAAPGPDVVTPMPLSRQSSPSSSRAPTPPRKSQYPKGHAPYHHNPHHHPGSLPLLQQPPQNAPPHPPAVSTPATQSQPLPAPAPPPGNVVPPPPGVAPPPPPVSNAPLIPLTSPNSAPPPAPPPSALAMHPPPNQNPRLQNCNENWEVVPMKSCKEEVPKYLANFQDFSPEELRHMGDDELKERGMPQEALVQLRSCVSKQQAANGINCLNREPEVGGRSAVGRSTRHTTPQEWCGLTRGGAQVHESRPAWRVQGMDAAMLPHLMAMQPCYSGQSCYPMPCSGGKAYRKCDTGCRQLSQQMRSVRIEDERRPCSNGSSASDSSVGSHSPPDTPVLGGTAAPPHQLWERGFQRKDSTGGGGGNGGGGTGNENWQNSSAPPEERLHEDGRPERLEAERNERTEWPERGDERIRNFQPPSGQRNTLNRPRGLSKGNPPGIQTIPRGRVHHGLDKNRREAGPLNGEMTPPGPFPITTPLTVGNNVPFTTPASSFITHPGYPTIPTYPTFRHGNYLPPNQPAYPYHHHNGEMWNQYPHSPHLSHNFIRHMVAFSPAVPPPKLTCYNCGNPGHLGIDCKELTLEEITQQGQFHLDYKPHKESGDCSSEK